MRILHLLLLSATCLASSFANPVQTLKIGAQARTFSLQGVDDDTYTLGRVDKLVIDKSRDSICPHGLASFQNADILAIIFTCNHCPDARASRGRIKQLHTDYKDKGVAVVVTISGNDSKDCCWMS